MTDVLRIEIWNRAATMLLVVVVKAATYQVRWTDCQRTVNAVLTTGADPESVPVDTLTVAADFGVAAAAEKYAKRLLLERMQDTRPEWEPLYDGSLTIQSLSRVAALFPKQLEAARAEDPAPVKAAVVVKGETPEDFAARRAAHRQARQREAARGDALAALSAAGRTVVRASGGTPPKVVRVEVEGRTATGEAVKGYLKRVTTMPPRTCEIEAPMTVAAQRVEWTFNGKLIGVSNP